MGDGSAQNHPHVWAEDSRLRDPRGLALVALALGGAQTRKDLGGASESSGPKEPLQTPRDFPSLLAGCQPGPFKDIPEGVASLTSARGMNEQEPVLTQLPLSTRGRSYAQAAGGRRTSRPARGRAGAGHGESG